MNLDCANVKKIKDVTDQIDYKDKVGGGEGDSDQVSCGQSKNDELQNKYNKHFKDIKGIPEKLIASIMCKCCNKLKPTGKEKVSWLKFYECMKSKLDMKDHPKTIKKLDGLIAWHETRV